MVLPSGTSLGTFQVAELLGSGGMGEVYRARDTKLGRDVALKVLPEAFTKDTERLTRFEREARLLAALHHPNIGAVYDIQEADGVHFIVMELVEGDTLAALLAEGPLSIADTLPVFAQIAQALNAAHEEGIVHRDLKPDNIKVNEAGQVKVLDFGIAKVMDAPLLDSSEPGDNLTISPPGMLTKEGVIVGTPSYMSPEQVAGKPVDKRCDVWAFGCCLYQALTGNPPFTGETMSHILAAILERNPDWSALPPDMPTVVRGILRRCFEKKPSHRLSHMGDIAIGFTDTASALMESGEQWTTPLEEKAMAWRPAAGQPIPRREHWMLESRLGEGGFGEVWLAAHEKTKEKRVFKFCFELERVRSLRREVVLFRLLKESLGDRNDIAHVLEWEFHKPPFFLEAEHTEGGDLAQWAEKQGGIDKAPLADRLEIVAQAAVALGAAHSIGVLHKDVKPSNMLVVESAEGGAPGVRLTDFGIGALTDPGLLAEKGITAAGLTETLIASKSSSGSGTRMYMAPELLEGKASTIQSDIYSLGVVLYQMVTGDFSHALAPGWERDVDDDLLREDIAACIDGQPERRLAGAAELTERLRDLDGRRARREAKRKAREKAERAHRRHRIAIFSAIAGCLLAVLLSFFAIREAGLRATEADLRAKAEDQEAIAKQQRDKAERSLYGSHMLLARKGWEEGQAGRLRELLDAHVPQPGEADLRGWEWRYLDALCNRDLRTLRGHEGEVAAVAWSPDGLRLASAGVDHTVRIWDGARDEAVATLRGHTGRINTVAWSPDGSRLVSGADDGAIVFWEPSSGERLLTFDGVTSGVASVAWSPDGRRLVWAGQGETSGVLDPTTGKAVDGPLAQARFAGFLAWSPDGKWLATRQGSANVDIWDANTGQMAYRFRISGSGQQYKINSATWSPDSRLLAATRVRVHLGEVTGKPGEEKIDPVGIGHKSTVRAVSWSPHGPLLASGGDDMTVRIWNSATSQTQATFYGHTAPVTSVIWSPDARRLASASQDGTIRIWDAARTQEALSERAHSDTVRSACWSPDSHKLATANHDGDILVLDTLTQETTALPGHFLRIYHVAWSPDGRRLATAGEDTTVKVWNAAGGAAILTLRGHEHYVNHVDWSPDGRKLASASRDATVMIWDAETGETIRRLGHTGRAVSAEWSPDGRRLASSGEDGMILIWSADSGELVLRIQGPPSLSYDRVSSKVAWRPDGRRLARGRGDGSVGVWDATTGKAVYAVGVHASNVTSLAWSPNGRRLAAGGQDGVVVMLDADTGEQLLSLPAHVVNEGASNVNTVAWSPDGMRLATGGSDKMTRVWDARPMTPQLRIERRALSLVECFFDQGLPNAAVVEKIQQDRSISDEVRRLALTYAKHWDERNVLAIVKSLFDEKLLITEVMERIRNDRTIGDDARNKALILAQNWPLPRLNDMSWYIVRSPYNAADDFDNALRRAEEVSRLEPENSVYLTTLGAAQYRVDQYRETLATLTRSDRLSEAPAPNNLAFRAMTHHQLGQKEQAQATLERLREMMQEPDQAKNQDARGSLREAEALITGKQKRRKD